MAAAIASVLVELLSNTWLSMWIMFYVTVDALAVNLDRVLFLEYSFFKIKSINCNNIYPLVC